MAVPSRIYECGSAMNPFLQSLENDLSQPFFQLPGFARAGRRSLDEKIARAVAADRRERGDALIGAAFGAAGNMDRLVPLHQQHASLACDPRGERPRGWHAADRSEEHKSGL